MDITPRDEVEKKTLGHGQRISIAIGMLATLIPAFLTAFGGLDFIVAHLPLLLTGVGSLITGGVTSYIAVRRMRIDAGKAAPVLLLLLPLCLWSGCGTVNKDNINAGAKWAKEYYNQPNVAEIFRAEGTNLTMTVSGATMLCLSTPLPPKTIIPREASWSDGMFDTIKSIAPWVFMGWAVQSDAFGSSSSSKSVTTTAQ